MLSRLIYYSQNRCSGRDGATMADLNAILDASIRNNERDDVTGALLHDARWFVQILEGERETLSATLARLMIDPRHDKVTVMDVRPIGSRLFGNWWMAFANMDGENSDLLARHGLATHLDPRPMSATTIVALALDVAKNGLIRRLAARAA